MPSRKWLYIMQSIQNLYTDVNKTTKLAEINADGYLRSRWSTKKIQIFFHQLIDFRISINKKYFNATASSFCLKNFVKKAQKSYKSHLQTVRHLSFRKMIKCLKKPFNNFLPTNVIQIIFDINDMDSIKICCFCLEIIGIKKKRYIFF